MRNGYASNVLWGRDYPHAEGVFQHLDDPDAEPVTRIALRNLFSHVPPRETVQMAGENVIRVFGLDGDYLQKVAVDIGAQTLARARRRTRPVDVPEHRPHQQRLPRPGRPADRGRQLRESLRKG